MLPFQISIPNVLSTTVSVLYATGFSYFLRTKKVRNTETRASAAFAGKCMRVILAHILYSVAYIKRNYLK